MYSGSLSEVSASVSNSLSVVVSSEPVSIRL